MKSLPLSLLAASLLAFAHPAGAATPLGSLAEIERSLDSGASVAVAIDLSQCTPSAGGATPTQTRGGLRIGAYRVTEDGTLSFADEHFTVGRDGKPIQQFLRYQVHPDSRIDFSMAVFALPGYQQNGATLGYRCAINQGLRFTAS
ncbi:VirK family protein [Xanthomonas sp. SI]|uniref:VirK family protein n=1 Tax=Xanthomonas sp. SI TaxID=2724123 RepID=UPI00163A2C5B|nr:VirK family protein [Xanthomonas sp. SI]QNH12161.1 virk protein [Xanthomonas sp. SI]